MVFNRYVVRYNLRRCMWKKREHFQRKTYWSIIAYNIRVMTGHILRQMEYEYSNCNEYKN